MIPDDAENNPKGTATPGADATPGTAVPGPIASSITAASPSPTPEAYSGMLSRYDWVGILGTGQSLSVGWTAPNVLDASPSVGHNLKLFDANGVYDITNPNAPSLSLVPLNEPLRPIAATASYPRNIAGESPHTAMGQQISTDAIAAAISNPVTVHSATGLGGQGMSVISKGGTGNAYAAGIFEAQAIARLAQQVGKTLGYGAIILTHGEADARQTDYSERLLQMWADYNADLRAVTQQNDAIPLILSQQATEPTSNAASPQSMLAAWKAAMSNPGKIVLAGPKTQYGYSSDNLHLPASGYRRMGIKYAEVYTHVVEQGHPWTPLQPNSVAFIAPRSIEIAFDVPMPPLAWDDAQPAVHQQVHTAWAAGHGFEVLDASQQPLVITSATIVGNSVILQLSAAAALPLTVQYAITQDVDNALQGGQSGGRIGHLRDSDNYIGYDAVALSCTATHASAQITCANGLASRALYDIVEPVGTQVVSFDSATTATLSEAWSGATGPQQLRFRSNQYNFCVSFSWVVSP